MKTFLGNIHADDLPRIEMLIQQIPKNPASLKMNFRVKDRNGSVRYINSEWLIKHDDQKQAVRITGFNQDITEIKIAEQSLKKSEANLRTIFDNTEISYLFLDSDFNIVSFNQPALELSKIHLSRGLAEGANFTDYLPEDKNSRIQKRYRKVLNGDQFNLDITLPNQNDSPSWYKMQVLPVSDIGNKIHGLIITMTDITEQKKSEIHRNKITTELIQRNKELEQFTYIISHNLRVPVANILGLSDALNDINLKPAEMTEIARALHNSTGKLDDVILDLNHILQVKKKLSEKRETINFSDLVSDILSTYGDLEEQKIEIRTDFNSVNEVIFLKSYLYSIFYNLISNSIKYRRPEILSIIEIKSENTSNGIRLTFRDNGRGLNLEKIRNHLFGLYKRFHNDIKGKGMGLFMVKAQVEALGGKISVSSEVNSGTEFIIEFASIS
jgi:PAS domain S-box-containing protein